MERKLQGNNIGMLLEIIRGRLKISRNKGKKVISSPTTISESEMI